MSDEEQARYLSRPPRPMSDGAPGSPCPWCGHDPQDRVTEVSATIGTVIGVVVVLGALVTAAAGVWWLAVRAWEAVLG